MSDTSVLLARIDQLTHALNVASGERAARVQAALALERICAPPRAADTPLLGKRKRAARSRGSRASRIYHETALIGAAIDERRKRRRRTAAAPVATLTHCDAFVEPPPRALPPILYTSLSCEEQLASVALPHITGLFNVAALGMPTEAVGSRLVAYMMEALQSANQRYKTPVSGALPCGMRLDYFREQRHAMEAATQQWFDELEGPVGTDQRSFHNSMDLSPILLCRLYRKKPLVVPSTPRWKCVLYCADKTVYSTVYTLVYFSGPILYKERVHIELDYGAVRRMEVRYRRVGSTHVETMPTHRIFSLVCMHTR